MREFVKMEVRGPVAVLRIDRPKALNALNGEVIAELMEQALQAERDPAIRALVLYNGENFAAGADIKAMAECNPIEIKAFSFAGELNRLERLAIPTIAALRGYTLGGGLELALCCDFRIAGESTQLGFPETNLGVFPGAGGSIRMTRLIGAAATKELVYLGERIDAQRALALGIVSRVVPDADVLEQALALADKLAGRAPLALAAAKRVIQYGQDEADMEKATAYELEVFSGLFATEDQKEGMRAFIEKRRPVFKGK